ncbi:Imm21 family immunity protein [Nonomuraea typhae]|uniref:Imm21 family immunity protein n=1 Tax=Nonomuraea typhae TaxID=2603600 RepID=A0ABW7Z702_9ACTN
MKNSGLSWITSLGGPLIALPESVIGTWRGALGPDDDDDPPEEDTDYWKVCELYGLAAVFEHAGRDALALTDVPAPATYLPGRSLLVRRLAQAGDQEIVSGIGEIARTARWESIAPLTVTEPLVLFDSVYPGAEAPEAIRLDLSPGRYEVRAVHHEPDGGSPLRLLLVSLSLTDRTAPAFPGGSRTRVRMGTKR